MTVAPLLVLQARIEARVILFRANEYEDIDEAMAPLRDYALAAGIVDMIGADATIAMIYRAFGIEEAPHVE